MRNARIGNIIFILFLTIGGPQTAAGERPKEDAATRYAHDALRFLTEAHTKIDRLEFTDDDRQRAREYMKRSDAIAKVEHVDPASSSPPCWPAHAANNTATPKPPPSTC